MPKAQYRHFDCRITDDLIYKGMRTIYLENDLVRVGILLDKGADIFEFLHKPTDTDFMWKSPQGLMRPDRFTPTRSASSGAFLDSYHGGWQEILPGGGPADYRGAELGLHGEVTHLGWDYDILEDSPEKVSVRLTVDCVRTPLRLERTMTLLRGKAVLFFDETLTNLSSEAQDFMWGHHPAFGAPFLREGVRLFVPAMSAEIHAPAFAASSMLEPGSIFAWPNAPISGGAIDLSCIPGPEAGFAELIYLKDLSAGWYAVLDPMKKIGIGLSWPVDVFPYIWFWLVYGRAPGYPWWDRVYCIALEPWTSIPNSLPKVLELGANAHLKGGAHTSVAFTASVIQGRDRVNKIDQNGNIT
jgi:hypothetical protein